MILFQIFFALTLTSASRGTWTVANFIDPKEGLNLQNFHFMHSDHVELKDGEVRLGIEYFGIDACTKDLLLPEEERSFSFLQQFGISLKVGDPFVTFTSLFKVKESKNPNVTVGEFYQTSFAMLSSEMIASDLSQMTKVENSADGQKRIALLGTSGLTAMGSINEFVKPQEGEVAYVSAAAGALGLFVVQILKAKGVSVIGSAGTDDKVKYLESLGIVAFNYKTRPPAKALPELAPEGLDIYYDNVGGTTLEAALDNMKTFGRVIASGMVSQYGKSLEDRYGVKTLLNIVDKQLSIQGFIAGSHPNMPFSKFPEYGQEIMELYDEGLVKSRISEYEWEDFPKAFYDLFAGNNIGKVVVAGPRSSTPKAEL